MVVRGDPVVVFYRISGYKGVGIQHRCKGKPYQAKVQRGGKEVYLGIFATAEEELGGGVVHREDARGAGSCGGSSSSATADDGGGGGAAGGGGGADAAAEDRQ